LVSRRRSESAKVLDFSLLQHLSVPCTPVLPVYLRTCKPVSDINRLPSGRHIPAIEIVAGAESWRLLRFLTPGPACAAKLSRAEPDQLNQMISKTDCQTGISLMLQEKI
jgi:hypothetical protein